ncbi:ATP-binding protein [Terrabacter sp. NPDC000476]|uniref:ATP-binding protein n=1 Tax=Terrabacter sp. NPDC000476 TaxID=3154258 RepID=UPI003329A380
MTPQRPDGDTSARVPAVPRLDDPSTSNEMQLLFDRTDWASTPLGPVDTWPADLRSIVDVCLSSGFPMLVCWGPELVMIYNDGYRTMLGQSKHPAALGRPVRDVWPEVWDVIGPMFDGVLGGGPATWVEDEQLVVDRFGFLEEAYFTWSYGAIHDERGGVVGVLNVATETTAKVLAERRVRVSTELTSALVGAADPAEVRDRALGVLRAHTADHLGVDLTWGRPDEAPDGRHVVPVVEPGLSAPTAHLLLTENPRRPWDASLQVFAELCASQIAMALSGIRHLQDERHRAESLAELDVAKSDFFANVSHELRTPLALIAGPVEDALGTDGLSPELRERFELIRRNTDRLTGLVDRLLDLTRLESGAVEPHWVPADVEELTTGIAENFRPAIERLGLELDVVCDELDREVHVDVDMFERIVLNLLSNALKFTPEGRIGVRLVAHEQGYAVSVTDTGIGIAERDLERVFDRFRQLDRSDDRRSREGAGIGLALVKQIVELLGGRITVRSAEGAGSTFTVVLPWGSAALDAAHRPSITPRPVASFLGEVDDWAPRASGAVAAVAVDADAADNGDTRAELPRPVLLVVEDNHDMRDYIVRHVVEDYDVVTVRDGVEALAQLRSARPSIVLADVMMPRMDGLTLVREIRADPALRDLPVVLLSARAGVDASAAGLEHGADDYVVKPFQPRELRARLSANLLRAQSRSRDGAWLRAILGALQEPFVVADASGAVVELNDAFHRTFGWSLADGPLEPPYPWATDGATGELDAANPAAEDRHRILRKGGGEAWVRVRSASVPGTADHEGFVLAVFDDETRERESRMRRELAARIAVDLAAADDLDQAVATAVTGFTVLFDGEVTLRVSPHRGEAVLLSPRGRVRAGELPDDVRRGLESGPRSHDALAGEKRDGLLLLPTAHESDCRAWVAFDEPRLVASDELIVGDLLAQAFGQAVDRVVAQQAREAKESQLEAAIESHRLIGHAVGVLIERHKVTGKQGFEMLRQASLNRNIKLREIAARVVETGQDPDTA